jgi:hypothetical protein
VFQLNTSRTAQSSDVVALEVCQREAHRFHGFQMQRSVSSEIKSAPIVAFIALLCPLNILSTSNVAAGSDASDGASNASVVAASAIAAAGVGVLGNSVDAGGLSKIPDEQRLLRKLMANYDQSVRPVFNISHSVVVNFSLTLVQIMDMVSGWNLNAIVKCSDGFYSSCREQTACWDCLLADLMCVRACARTHNSACARLKTAVVSDDRVK